MSTSLPSGEPLVSYNERLRCNHHGTNPFLRWAGGKKWLVKAVDLIIGKKSFKQYHEPFLGGGAMFFAVGSRQPAFLSDINQDLIDTFIAVRDDPSRVIYEMSHFENTSEFYYRVRSQEPDCLFQKAGKFIYLNQTSFNGLYRVNLKGQYNVPFGSRTKPFLDRQAILSCSRQLENATICVQDFEQAIELVADGDLGRVDELQQVTFRGFT